MNLSANSIHSLPPGTIPIVVETYLDSVLILRKESGIPTYSYPPPKGRASNVEIYWDGDLVFQAQKGLCTLNRLTAVSRYRRALA